VLTHLHYDHCGNLGRFPAARFHLQEPEIHYATGRYMAYPKLSHSFEVEDVCDVVRLNFRRRIKFYNGDAELAPGIELYAASGHSAGQTAKKSASKLISGWPTWSTPRPRRTALPAPGFWHSLVNGEHNFPALIPAGRTTRSTSRMRFITAI
jgi:glyoxylase-like metal-dependent hydrolase (beta-lactamase superfamily II)